MGANDFNRCKWNKSLQLEVLGSIGATRKDTRTQSRGRVELEEGGGTGWGGVEGRRENADNCN